MTHFTRQKPRSYILFKQKNCLFRRSKTFRLIGHIEGHQDDC